MTDPKMNVKLPRILKDGVATLLARFTVPELLHEIGEQRPDYMIHGYPKSDQNQHCPTCGAEVDPWCVNCFEPTRVKADD